MVRALRVEEISIGMPEPGNVPFVSVTLQTVDLDADMNVVSISGRVDVESAPASKTALDVVTVFDPVQGQNVSISGAALNEAVLLSILGYIAADRSMTIIPPGYLVDVI